jgi:F-type H+-transporting ATPase subunit epsilon
VSGNTVSILSDIAELADQIDRQRAVRAMEAAEELLRKEHDAEAVAALARAHARLNATGGLAGTAQGAH